MSDNTSDWRQVNDPPEAVSLDMSSCCKPIASSGSPIDNYYDTVAHLLKLGTPEALYASPTLGQLLVMGLVTTVESYFRSVLLGVCVTCPLTRESIADQPVAFGALEYYGSDSFALGIFDGASFASSHEIKKRTKAFTGIELPDRSSVGVALANFEQICHMRHAAIHAQGALSRGNAKALGVTSSASALRLEVDLPHLHLAAKACSSLIRSYNTAIYEGMVSRWLSAGHLKGDWKQDKTAYQPLFDLFKSKIDNTGPKNAYLAYLLLRPSIIKSITQRR